MSDFYARAFKNYRSISPNKFDQDELACRYFEKNYRKLIGNLEFGSAVDLGCGSGALVSWLKSYGWSDCVGVDLSEQQVSLAKKNGANCVVGDATEFMASYDRGVQLIFSRDFFEHLEREALLEILGLIHTKLLNTGKCVVQMPNADSSLGASIFYSDITHRTFLTPRGFTQLARLAGFSSIEIVRVKSVFSRFQYLRQLILHCAIRVEEFQKFLVMGGMPICSPNFIAILKK